MTASFRGTETKRIAELWNCERRTTKLNIVTQNGGGGPEDRRVRRTRDPVASLMTDLTDR